MIYGKKYVIRWTPQLKRVIVLTIIACFILGTLLGFIIGIFINRKHAQIQGVRTPSTMSTQIVKKPTDELNEPTPVYYDVPLDEDLQDYIFMLCDERHIPVALVLGLIETESSFRANVISKSNDYGLVQINKINHEWLSEKYGISDFLDPYQNVFCGITILAGHYERFQDIDKALMAYNLGATGAKRLWDKGIYTTSYVEKVKGAMAKYE